MRHELKKMALEEEQPGEALLKYLWKNYGSSRLADDQIIWYEGSLFMNPPNNN